MLCSLKRCGVETGDLGGGKMMRVPGPVLNRCGQARHSYSTHRRAPRSDVMLPGTARVCITQRNRHPRVGQTDSCHFEPRREISCCVKPLPNGERFPAVPLDRLSCVRNNGSRGMRATVRSGVKQHVTRAMLPTPEWLFRAQWELSVTRTGLDATRDLSPRLEMTGGRQSDTRLPVVQD